MKFRILGIPPSRFSSASRLYFFFLFLARRHQIVKLLDTTLPFPFRIQEIIRDFVPSRLKHTQKSSTNTRSFIRKSRFIEHEIEQLKAETDLVLQIGCRSSPYVSRILRPYYVYIDSTMKMAEREHPIWAPFDSVEERNRWIVLERMVYENANKVFTMSEYTKRMLIRDYGINEAKVVTVYAGLNLLEIPEFSKDYDKKTILFVGKDFERKGGFTILKAFKEVKKQVKDAKLFILGCSPKTDICNVTTKGFVRREELLTFYREASIFVMPSTYEPFGLVFLEAMAHRMPCIGSTQQAMPEIIKKDETGFLIPPGDYRALANRIVFLLRNEDAIKEMGEKGCTRVKQIFTWDKAISRMTNEFRKDLEQ